MNKYMMIYMAPGLHESFLAQLTDHIDGCVTSSQIGYCLFVCFESETSMQVLKGDLNPDETDLILIEIDDIDQLHLDFRNDIVEESMMHPFDPDSECKRERDSEEQFSVNNLLEKISVSGFDSLTDKEKAYLRKNSEES